MLTFAQLDLTGSHPTMFTLRPEYLATSITILVTLICIALWAHDGFVRPFLGDVLAVIWLYAALMSFINLSVKQGITLAWTGAVTLEFAQYAGLINLLGLQDFKPARIILGATFDPLDLLAYTLGAACVCGVEYTLGRRSSVR
jgi:hypothetical protein